MKKPIVLLAACLALLPIVASCKPQMTETAETHPTAAATTATYIEKYTVEPQPVSEAETPESIIVGDVRVQLLSSGLVRIEQSTDGTFCDLPSFNCVNRDKWYSVAHSEEKADGVTKIKTDRYTVVIPDGSKKLSGVYVENPSGETVWTYETKTSDKLFLPSPSDELASWYFTDSPRVLVSENGYALPADGTYEDKNGWTVETGALDAFVFVPDGDYKDFLRNFVTLTGRTDMLPMSGLGFWYSHYCKYTPELMESDLGELDDKKFPVDIVVCDVDWHTDEFINGSGLEYGYTVDESLIPDIKAFYDLIHSHGIEVLFNDHPHPVDGTKNLLDEAEIAYRTENLTKYLADGLDYWWYDRNWPGTCLNKITAKLSPYVTGQYVFYEIERNYYKRIAEANGEEYARRAMVLSNVDAIESGLIKYASELASHRYSVQWTGDIQGSMDSLHNEIMNAVIGATEMNLPYMSCDLGGHVSDCGDNGYARWLQFGALAPVCRVHAYSNWDRKPWNYGEEAETVATNYVKMRYRLMPTFYSLSHENYESGLPLIRRLDVNYPELAEAGRNDEWLLGDYILVAPLASDSGEDTRDVFIPTGTWIDVFSGKEYIGPQTVTVTHPIETSPLFVKKGGIVLLADDAVRTADVDFTNITLDLYPSRADTAAVTLYEDDRRTEAYKDGHFRTTEITSETLISESSSKGYDVILINIAKAIGEFAGTSADDMRTYNVRIHMTDGIDCVTKVTVDGKPVEYELHKKDESAMPFMTDGASRDGDTVTVSFTAPVYKGADVAIYVETSPVSESESEYDSTPLDFTASLERVKRTALDGMNVSDGTDAFVVFGYDESGVNIVSGRAGEAAENENCTVTHMCDKWDELTVNGNAVRLYMNFAEPGESYGTAWNDGGETKTQSSYIAVTRHDVSFSVSTESHPAEYKLYFTTLYSGVRVTVSDRAGNRRTFESDDNAKSETCFVLTVKANAFTASELNFDITKTSGTEGTFDAIILTAMTVSEVNE